MMFVIMTMVQCLHYKVELLSLSRNQFSSSIGLESSLPSSQDPATGPYLEPAESSPHPHILYLENCYIILTPTPRPFARTLHLEVSEPKLYTHFLFTSFVHYEM